VRIRPRRGAVVVSLTKRDFLEAYQVREALEALGVRLAVPIMSQATLDDLDEQLEAMARHAAAGDVDAFFESNATFHEAFVEASGNRKLVEVYRRLIVQMRPYRRPSARVRGNIERSIAEHRQILVAARKRDVDAAVERLMRHVEVPQRLLERMSDEEFSQSVAEAALS
jgi:DNA-binding GntR family transcriptional regulator